MHKKDIDNLDFFKQQEAFKKEVENKRRALKRRIVGSSPLAKVLNWGSNEVIDPVILDEWFIKSCDKAPEVKKYLNFYYEKIKECRYDEIATRIVENRCEYEDICKEGLDCSEILKEEGSRPPLFLKLQSFAFKPIFDEDDEFKYDVKDTQESISKILVEENFHVSIFIIGLTVTKLHDFARLSLISHELGVLSSEGEIPTWTLDCQAKPRQKLRDKFDCQHNAFAEEESNEIYHTSNLYEKLDPFMDIQDYWKYLTELSMRVSGTISALYNSAADGFLISDWNRLNEENEDESIENAKKMVFSETQKKFSNVSTFSATPSSERGSEYIEFRRRLSENFRSYKEIFTVKKPPAWNFKERSKTLSAIASQIIFELQKMTRIENPQNFARFDPCDPEALKKFSSVSTVPMNKLILVMNSSDYLDFCWFRDEEDPSKTNYLRTFLEDLKKEGLTICESKAIYACDFKIVQKGMFILNNVSSRIYVKSVSPAQEITYSHKDFTVTKMLDFGLGIHVLGLGVCPSKIYFEKK